MTRESLHADSAHDCGTAPHPCVSGREGKGRGREGITPRPKVGIHRLGLLGAGVRIAWMGATHLRSGGVW